MMDENTGPFLVAAVLCERVLQEKNDLISIIRMTDRIAITTSAAGSPETMPPTPIMLQALISFKSGSAKDRETIKWRTITPSGIRQPDQLFPILFEGDDRGVNLVITLNMNVDQEGVYWFEVVLDEKMFTRIPLRILYQRIGQDR